MKKERINNRRSCFVFASISHGISDNLQSGIFCKGTDAYAVCSGSGGKRSSTV